MYYLVLNIGKSSIKIKKYYATFSWLVDVVKGNIIEMGRSPKSGVPPLRDSGVRRPESLKIWGTSHPCFVFIIFLFRWGKLLLNRLKTVPSPANQSRTASASSPSTWGTATSPSPSSKMKSNPWTTAGRRPKTPLPTLTPTRGAAVAALDQPARPSPAARPSSTPAWPELRSSGNSRGKWSGSGPTGTGRRLPSSPISWRKLDFFTSTTGTRSSAPFAWGSLGSGSPLTIPLLSTEDISRGVRLSWDCPWGTCPSILSPAGRGRSSRRSMGGLMMRGSGRKLGWMRSRKEVGSDQLCGRYWIFEDKLCSTCFVFMVFALTYNHCEFKKNEVLDILRLSLCIKVVDTFAFVLIINLFGGHWIFDSRIRTTCLVFKFFCSIHCCMYFD